MTVSFPCTSVSSPAQGVEHEAHHLTMRTNRHLKTIRSTHTRTLLYYCGIYTAIVLASIVQARTQRHACPDPAACSLHSANEKFPACMATSGTLSKRLCRLTVLHTSVMQNTCRAV